MTSNSGQNWFAPALEGAPVLLQDLPEDLAIGLLEQPPASGAPLLDAHAVLREALQACDAARRARKTAVSLRLLARNHYVAADANRLRQTLTQMVSAAIESAPAGGHLTIRSSRPADCALRIEVEERSSYLKHHRAVQAEIPKPKPAARRRR